MENHCGTHSAIQPLSRHPFRALEGIYPHQTSLEDSSTYFVLLDICSRVLGHCQDGLDRRLTPLVMISIGRIQVMNKLKNNLHLDHKNHTMGAT